MTQGQNFPQPLRQITPLLKIRMVLLHARQVTEVLTGKKFMKRKLEEKKNLQRGMLYDEKSPNILVCMQLPHADRICSQRQNLNI